jgi:hypothetical protein
MQKNVIKRSKTLRNCHVTLRNGKERLTVWNVHTVYDQKSETFAKSRSRFKIEETMYVVK